MKEYKLCSAKTTDTQVLALFFLPSFELRAAPAVTFA